MHRGTENHGVIFTTVATLSLPKTLTNKGRLPRVRISALSQGATGAQDMKNVYEVLRQKELELARLEKEVEALRVVAPLLSPEDAKDLGGEMPKPTLATQTTQQPIRIPQQAAVNQNPQPARAAGWEDTAKRWP